MSDARITRLRGVVFSTGAAEALVPDTVVPAEMLPRMDQRTKGTGGVGDAGLGVLGGGIVPRREAGELNRCGFGTKGSKVHYKPFRS